MPDDRPSWTPDGGALLCLVSDRGRAPLLRVDAATGAATRLLDGERQITNAQASADGRRLVFAASDGLTPADLFACDVEDGGAKERRLTDVNAALFAEVELRAPGRHTYRAGDGQELDAWVITPPGFDPGGGRRYPLVLEIHGGPHTAYGHSFFHEFHVLAGRGYAVLFTNPRGSHAYGQRFVEACVGDWGGKDYEDLMAGVDHALALGWVDPKRLYLTGGSYGGFMTNWIIGHTDRFRAAVTQRSISNNISAFGTSDIGWHFWEHEMGDATPWSGGEKLIFRSPLTYVTSVKTPLLILHAERDLRCPIEQAEQLFTALKVLGKEAVFVRFPEDNHDLTRGGKPKHRVEHARRIADWFDAHP